MLDRSGSADEGRVAFTLAASPGSPVENVALVVRGWGDASVSLSLDGHDVPRGRAFRFGHRQRLESTDLVVFAEVRATAPIRLVLTRR